MAFYRKNIGTAHQAVRLVLGIGAIAAGIAWLSGIAGWAAAAAGIGMVFTGIVGWCPACAVAGVGKETRS